MIRSILTRSAFVDSNGELVAIRRIVGKIEEKSDTLHGAVLLEVAGKEPTRLQIDTHSSENNREILLVAVVDIFGGALDQTSLPTNLSSNFVVRQSSSRENGNLLSSGCKKSA